MKPTHLVALGCLAAASTLPASAQRSINRGLHIPPVKTPVVIDGRLDDWETGRLGNWRIERVEETVDPSRRMF